MPRTSPFSSGPLALLPTFFGEHGLALDDQLRHADRLRRSGCTTMVVGGAEGEGPTLSEPEIAALIHGLAPKVGALGLAIWTPCTRTALRQAALAEGAGATFIVLSQTPYNKPTQAGLVRHVESIVGATPLPVMFRDDPSRTRISPSDETLAALCRTGIAAIALAPGDMRRAARLDDETGGGLPLLCGSDFDVALGQGEAGNGWLSSIVNVDPERCLDLQRARLSGDWRRAATLGRDLWRVLRVLDLGEHAVTVKYALARLGAVIPTVRLPLVPPPADVKQAIDGAVGAMALELDRADRHEAVGQ